MAELERIVIPRCIGCGAMHEFERCEGGCHEERLDLVAAADLEALAATEQAARARIEALLPAVRMLVEQQPAAGELRQAYGAVARAAREALHGAPAPARWPPRLGDPDGPLRIDVWRCRDCGAVDAPQECLGICIWRRFEWVTIGDWQRRSAHAEAVGVLEHRISGLLGRLAFATPRADAWQRSWRVLSREARELLGAHHEIDRPAEVHV